MKILFITRRAWPGIGGVEKHIGALNKELRTRNYDVNIITEKFERRLKAFEEARGVNYFRITNPHIKILGLITIWFELFKLRKIILSADIIHIHDVFVWYLPFRFLYRHKKVFTTFHGGQDVWPVPLKNKIFVKLAAYLSTGTIAVGDFIGKYYDIKPDYVIYGGAEQKGTRQKALGTSKHTNLIVWLGRLDKKADLPLFLKWLKTNGQQLTTIFIGDGEMRKKCERYGKVTGFVSDPGNYIKNAETVVPVGYLSFLEAKSFGAKMMTFASTPIKKDYWEDIKKLKKIPTWGDITYTYLKLWQKN